MDWKEYLFAEVKDPDTLQVLLRGIIVFLSALIIMRAGPKRMFGKGSAVDNVLVIILGGMLSRVITGAAAYLPVVTATIGIVLTERVVSWLNMYPALTKIISGKRTVLYRNGKFITKNMDQTMACKEDLYEATRLRLNTEDLAENVDEISMERNGEISVTKKKKA